MSFDANTQAEKSKNLLIAAENTFNPSSPDAGPVRAALLSTVHDSLCSLSPDQRDATYKVMQGIPVTPHYRIDEELEKQVKMTKFWAQAREEEYVNSLPESERAAERNKYDENGRNMSNVLSKLEDTSHYSKAFSIERDGHGEALALTFRWAKDQPLVAISLDNCDQK